MSFSFIAGNLLGRAAISYVLVLFIFTLACRFNLRAALRRSIRWYGLVAVLILTAAGMGVAASRVGAM